MSSDMFGGGGVQTVGQVIAGALPGAIAGSSSSSSASPAAAQPSSSPFMQSVGDQVRRRVAASAANGGNQAVRAAGAGSTIAGGYTKTTLGGG